MSLYAFSRMGTVRFLLVLSLCLANDVAASHQNVSSGRYLVGLLHTNDLHSSFYGPPPHSQPSHLFARLSTTITAVRNEYRQKGIFPILVDGGDWFEGSLFHTLGPLDASVSQYVPELEFLHHAHYDAVAFGNHEFNIGHASVIAGMIRKHQQSHAGSLPLLRPNFLMPSRECAELDEVLSQRYKVIEIPPVSSPFSDAQHSLRVGLFAVYSPDSAFLSAGMRSCVEVVGFRDSDSELIYDDFHLYVLEQVRYLRSTLNVHMVVLLAHMGSPEDEELVSFLQKHEEYVDVIVSSHTHYHYSFTQGRTFVSQAWCCGQALGTLNLEIAMEWFEGKGTVLNVSSVPFSLSFHPESVTHTASTRSLFQSSLHDARRTFDEPLSVGMNAILQHVPDPAVMDLTQKWAADVDRIFAPALGFRFEQPLATLHRDYVRAQTPGCEMHDLVATGILESLRKFIDDSVDVYMTGTSTIRADLLTQPPGSATVITFSDVFTMLSLGTPSETVLSENSTTPTLPGASLAHFFIKPAHLHALMEVFFTYYRFIHHDALMSFSKSLQYQLRQKSGLPFLNQFFDLSVERAPGSTHSYDLIHIAMPVYLAEYVWRIPGPTKGWIRVGMLDADGNDLTLEEIRRSWIYDTREYILFAQYLQSRKVIA